MLLHLGRTRMAVLVAALGLLVARQARADADTYIYGTIGCLLPADIGVAVPADDTASRFVIGWTWQIPLELLTRSSRELVHHRIVPSVDLLPESGGVAWRGRIGYRFDVHHVFAGAGVGVDRAGADLSPELGVKFAHLFDDPRIDVDLSMHMLVRAEIAPESGHLRGATILFGWNIFWEAALVETRRTSARWMGASLGLLAFMLAPRAHAHGEDGLVAVGIGALLPSEFGATVTTADPPVGKFVLGWSYQLAVDGRSRHRIVPSVDLLFEGGTSARGRVGYRYTRRLLFGGAGVGADRSGVSLSPEVGVKIPLFDDGEPDDEDPTLRLLTRVDVAPESGHVRAWTVLLGWSLF